VAAEVGSTGVAVATAFTAEDGKFGFPEPTLGAEDGRGVSPTPILTD